jgi:type II secretory pathway predicted ATPase ExeA
LSSTEFLQYILADFGRPTSGKNKAELLLDLGQFLVARGEKKLTTVLIIDEAHHLSEEILEEVRLLSNLETTDDKLLQIVLVGQPELDEKLDMVELRQLKQRIALRAQLGSLDPEETRDYIERRLQIAGATDPSRIFPPQTISAVYRHSRGLPRLINSISENALIAGYARQTKVISPEMIDDVAKDFRLDVVSPGTARSADGSELNARRAASALFDLMTTLQKPVNGSHHGTLAAIEEQKL